MLSMEVVLDVVNAKTRGGVSRTGEIEVQCPMGVCGHKKKPVYFSVNLERGQYNCFHCCNGCPYSGGMVDLFCLFNGLEAQIYDYAQYTPFEQLLPAVLFGVHRIS